MNKKCEKVIFDRTGKAKKTGRGKVEIRVYLATNVRKYIVVGETTKASWKTYQNSKELAIQVERYEEIVRAMKLLGEDMTIENFNAHIDTEKNKSKNPLRESFIEFMRSKINRENNRESTLRHKRHVLETLECYCKNRSSGQHRRPIRSISL